ncbi:MAG: geranylgeranylglyceryl/heptaprenylglyceryl phosphate synthase [Candidatus Poribacteria bacterium]
MGLVLEHLINIKKQKGAGYLVLIDPDKQSLESASHLAEVSAKANVDAILIGSSFLISDEFDPMVQSVKRASGLPIIIFPGSSNHISRYADAILFLSLISGRNPEFLIGEHVKAAPTIKRYGLEAIPTGYMLVDGGSSTSVQFISATIPIPRDKTDIAVAHAIAGELLGMKMIYLECGSGAVKSVPNDMISAVKKNINIPLIVGGGIVDPKEAEQKVRSGADFIVTGNILEKSGNTNIIKEFADVIHFI